MPKNIKKILRKKKSRSSTTLPMIAMLAALGVSSLTYTVTTVSADSGSSASKTTSIHMPKGKRGAEHGLSDVKRVKPVAAGIIQSINGSVVTIKDRGDAIYTIDVSGAKILQGGRGLASTTISVADLKVGNMLGARGVLTGTNVMATEVMTGPQHPFMQKLYEKKRALGR